jgi:hypothetical protein
MLHSSLLIQTTQQTDRSVKQPTVTTQKDEEARQEQFRNNSIRDYPAAKHWC